MNVLSKIANFIFDCFIVLGVIACITLFIYRLILLII